MIWIQGFFGIVLLALSLRTMLWHIQCWQIRWYRWDRMKSYLQTQVGQDNFWNVWFFKGILPRPKFTKRAFIIGAISSLFFVGFLWLGWNVWPYGYLGWMILCERIVWALVGAAVFLSGAPRAIMIRRLYAQAKRIRATSSDLTVIALTGSYGKTSTRIMLRAIIEAAYGSDNVLTSPGNINSEIGLARLMVDHADFFAAEGKKVFIAEIGACKRGEIATACTFVQPDISVITAVGDQHLELFGSQRNIQLGKWELAEAAKQAIIYNWMSPKLAEIADEKRDEMNAKMIPVVWEASKDTSWDGIDFHYVGQDYHLPWIGPFWEGNARLAISVGEQMNIDSKTMAGALRNLSQPKNALHKDVSKKRDYTLLCDLYSANSEGVLSALEVLGQAPGRKIFVGIPLLELGENEEKVHREIFQKLADIKAVVYWMKDDWAELGQAMCGKNFQGAKISGLEQRVKKLKSGDAVLLESRLPQSVLDVFSLS